MRNFISRIWSRVKVVARWLWANALYFVVGGLVLTSGYMMYKVIRESSAASSTPTATPDFARLISEAVATGLNAKLDPVSRGMSALQTDVAGVKAAVGDLATRVAALEAQQAAGPTTATISAIVVAATPPPAPAAGGNAAALVAASDAAQTALKAVAAAAQAEKKAKAMEIKATKERLEKELQAMELGADRRAINASIAYLASLGYTDPYLVVTDRGVWVRSPEILGLTKDSILVTTAPGTRKRAKAIVLDGDLAGSLWFPVSQMTFRRQDGMAKFEISFKGSRTLPPLLRRHPFCVMDPRLGEEFICQSIPTGE